MILKTKTNLAIIFFIIFNICFIVFLIRPLFLEIEKTSRDFTALKQKFLLLEIKTKNLEKFKKQFQEIKPNLEKIDTFFVNAELPVDLIRFLEKISQDCKISMKIAPSQSQKIEEDPWPSLNFQITAAGSFPNFLKFLEKLESSSYLIEIRNLDIARLNEAELKSKEFEDFSPGDIKVNFLLKVFAK